MNYFLRKKNSGKSKCQSIYMRRAKIWKRIASMMLCAVLFVTNTGGPSIAAADNLSFIEESEEQLAEEVSEPEEAAPSGEVSESEEAAPSGEVSEPAEEAEQDEATPEPDGEGKEEAEPDEEVSELAEEAVYTLHLTHYFRFTVNGEGRSVRTEETLELTEADFEDGVCALDRYAYDVPQITVTEAGSLSLDDFDENREGGARIIYAVNSGWQMVPAGKEESAGTVLREIFQGSLSDYEFVPANVVTFTVNYQYSKTGGLYGVTPNAPETIQALAEEENGNYVFEFPIKSKSGFRIVLNPVPLDKYLNKQPPEDAMPEELQQMLDNGDFNGNIAEHEVYAYQQKNGPTSDPDYAIKNDTYGNIYSDEYNEAWNNARIFTAADTKGADGYEVMAVCGDSAGEHPGQTNEKHGANELKNPKLKITLTKAQLENALENGRSITVNYRRNATWYKAEHWVPEKLSGLTQAEIAGKTTASVDGVDYVLLDSETLQGRVGALTRAAAKTEGSVYEKLTPLPFEQELIRGTVSIGDLDQNSANEANKPTVIKIYYKAAENYRVIFDTDYAYIPRQQVSFGKSVDFNKVTDEPERKGYTFVGWQYLKKGAVPDADGKYDDNDYGAVTKIGDTYELTIDADFFNKAQFKTTDGVPALHLYPKWESAKTNITVVLWTEDLDGQTDVQATAEGGNVKPDGSDYYSQKYEDYKALVEPRKPALNGSTQASEGYSNVGSFTMQVETDSSLKDADGSLSNAIYEEVKKEFNSSPKAEDSSVDPITFYDYCGFEVMHETDGGMDYTTATANADGKTMVYVYFTRKIYTLKFHYYGTAENHDYAVATGTCGYSYAGKKCYDSDGNLNFNFKGTVLKT